MPEPVAATLLLDTHAWLWLMNGEAGRFDAESLALLEAAAAANALLVPAIATWEIAMLEAKGRISLGSPCDAWIERALTAPGIRLAPLSPRIAVESTRLPGDFHGDPADRMIVATARLEPAAIVTADRQIIGYAERGHVMAVAL